MTTPVALQSGQWEIDGLTFGLYTSINVAKYSIGSPDMETNDIRNPRADGEKHGREYRGGRTIAFDLNALSDGWTSGLDILASLEQRWNAAEYRLTPGRYSLLRYKIGYRTRRVWGSTREFATDSSIDFLGNIPVTANFRTVDPYFYDDVERTNTISIAPVSSGGLIPPLSEPLTTLGVSESPGVITVGGNEAAWTYFVIYGPITSPRIQCLGEWDFQLNMTIPDGEFVSIDPRPWSRGIRLNGVSAVGGSLSQSSPRLEDLRLKPGTHEIILSGIDPTNTAYLLTGWRDTYSSY